MSDEAAGAVIGPNAVLQLLPQIERIGGAARVARMLAEAGIFEVPDGRRMIPETQAMRLHQVLRRDAPDLAPALAARAGRATADYILAYRIPVPARTMLKLLPAPLAARGLSRAIVRHAWTFAGSGRFRALSPWRFEIAQNPIVRGEVSAVPLCHWHAAVFARLYACLVAPGCTCVETHCTAQPGRGMCRFDIRRSGATA
ncbi:bacteriochlorophyll 4-vinyl reductase [Marivita sp. GX14005]|uniref:bacteriochlorophyll 4-vinyl reductase n=1 Tax=Marivita sp. GX14005 TaxID=2942276 RepID=UPI002019F80F|nr:bacteriochlorophyll 4-vinyl reductase [Marivita sp. GX14005]MCL3883099.1 bacteriochlorophyll 4-vinyl reductase [Marivita sp. GX14005]